MSTEPKPDPMKLLTQEDIAANEATHTMASDWYGAGFCSVCKMSEFWCWENKCPGKEIKP